MSRPCSQHVEELGFNQSLLDYKALALLILLWPIQLLYGSALIFITHSSYSVTLLILFIF